MICDKEWGDLKKIFICLFAHVTPTSQYNAMALCTEYFKNNAAIRMLKDNLAYFLKLKVCDMLTFKRVQHEF